MFFGVRLVRRLGFGLWVVPCWRIGRVCGGVSVLVRRLGLALVVPGWRVFRAGVVGWRRRWAVFAPGGGARRRRFSCRAIVYLL